MSDVLNKTLMALVAETAEIETVLISGGGELTPELEARLAVVDVQLPEKIDGYAAIMDRMGYLASYYTDRAEALLVLSNAAKNVIRRLEANIKLALETSGESEFLGNDFRFKLQASPGSVVIDSEDAVEGAYKVTETITKIDKKRVAEDLKAGVPVKGAHLERGTHIRRYNNTPGRSKKAVSE